MTSLQNSAILICSVCLLTSVAAVWPQGVHEEAADAPEIPLVPVHNPDAMSDDSFFAEDAGVNHQQDTQELQASNHSIRSDGHPAAAGNLYGTGPVVVGGGDPRANAPDAPETPIYTFGGRKLAMSESSLGLDGRELAPHGRQVLILAMDGRQSAAARPAWQ